MNSNIGAKDWEETYKLALLTKLDKDLKCTKEECLWFVMRDFLWSKMIEALPHKERPIKILDLRHTRIKRELSIRHNVVIISLNRRSYLNPNKLEKWIDMQLREVIMHDEEDCYAIN